MIDMFADQVLEQSDRRVVAGRGMATTAVVERLDVLEQISLYVRSRRVGRAVHPLVPQAVEEALGRGVVPAVAIAAHGVFHLIRGELALHRITVVLAATVAVEEHTATRLATEPSHRQRVGDDVGGHPRLDRTVDDLAVEQLQYDGQTQPAPANLDVGDVVRPPPVWCLGRKFARQRVRRHRQRMPGVSRRREAPLVSCPDALLAHQRSHRTQTDR